MKKNQVLEMLPFAPLRFTYTRGSEALADQINAHLVKMRNERILTHNTIHKNLEGYLRDDYRVTAKLPRFGSGEAKGQLDCSVRGTDFFILCDPVNDSNIYKMSGMDNLSSPDDQYQDLKRIIGAACGVPRRINVIMPFLYEGRQHRRSGRESLDCAVMLEELSNMGVENIITFDAHDPRVQNAVPLKGFDNFYTSYQFIRAIFEYDPDFIPDPEHLVIISPDEGGMTRSVYYAGILGVEMGMFYKRRDYTHIVDGRNPIVAHEYLGRSVEGKTVIIVDDMISSGESMLDVARELHLRKAAKILIVTTFGLFNKGMQAFDQAYEEHIFDHIFTTNLNFTPAETLSRPYYTQVDLSKYIALIIDTLNHNASVNDILNPNERIREMLSARLAHFGISVPESLRNETQD